MFGARRLRRREASAAILVVLIVVGALGLVLWLTESPPASPVTASIRLLPAKLEQQCRGVLRPALVRRYGSRFAEHFDPIERALCEGSSSNRWYALRLHLVRHELTIVTCDVQVLDRQGRAIDVPRIFGGPKQWLTLDPGAGLQAGFLTMNPKRDVLVEWMLLPGDELSTAQLRRVGGFRRPACKMVSPDHLPE